MHLVKSYERYKFFGKVNVLAIRNKFAKLSDHSLACLLYEVPGGNQVDGLPPAASNEHREKAGPDQSKTICGK